VKNLEKPTQIGQLARGVTLETSKRVIGSHPDAIIGNFNERRAATLNLDSNSTSLGINTIFDELFDNRSRTLNNFPGSHLASEDIRHDADATHRED
jgi:hypothetical protein